MVVTKIKSAEEVDNMRQSGKILTMVLDKLVESARAGVTPKDLDAIARKETKRLGGLPAFLGYQGFPATVCVSVNNEIVHAIPNLRELKMGDLVGIDYGVSYRGMITDAARTISIGKPNKYSKILIAGCYEALQEAISILRNGVKVGDVSSIIEKTLAKHGVRPIYSLTGHGVGHELHEDPVIPNYGTEGSGEVLKTGMTVAIEPIASTSTNDLYLADDGWTYMTRDGSLSAQFENTLLITDEGCEVLAS